MVVCVSKGRGMINRGSCMPSPLWQLARPADTCVPPSSLPLRILFTPPFTLNDFTHLLHHAYTHSQEARKYNSSSRMVDIQSEITARAIELLALEVMYIPSFAPVCLFTLSTQAPTYIHPPTHTRKA